MTLRHLSLSPSLRRLRGGSAVIGTSLLFASMAGCPDDTDLDITTDSAVDVATETVGGDSGSDTAADVAAEVAADVAVDQVAVDVATETTADVAGDLTTVDVAPADTAADTGVDAAPSDVPAEVSLDVGPPMDVPTTEVVSDIPTSDGGSSDVTTTDGGPDDTLDTNDGEVCEEPKVSPADLLGKPCTDPFYLALCKDDGSFKTAVYCGEGNVWVEPTPGDFCEFCNPVPCDYDTACIAIGYIGIGRARVSKHGVSVAVA